MSDGVQTVPPCGIMVGTMPSISERMLGLSGARRRILRVLMDPEQAYLGPEGVCKAARVARSTYWEARRDETFLDLLEDVREGLFPCARILLGKRIIDDAMTPLEEADNAAALVKTREQAAAILGIPIKP